MPFSEKVKLEAKVKASFRCCICQRLFVEVHHIIPQSKGGPDTLDNAAPLCASCHDLFGNNPDKRKQIRQMRDEWWLLMEQRRYHLEQASELDDYLVELGEQPKNINLLREKNIMLLYYCVTPEDDFDTAAEKLVSLIKTTQEKFPNLRRVLFLDIEGHRNVEGGFDDDMFEFQESFILGFLLSYLSEVYLPWFAVKNKQRQLNDDFVGFTIFKDKSDIENTIFPEVDFIRMFDADTKKWSSTKPRK